MTRAEGAHTGSHGGHTIETTPGGKLGMEIEVERAQDMMEGKTTE